MSRCGNEISMTIFAILAAISVGVVIRKHSTSAHWSIKRGTGRKHGKDTLDLLNHRWCQLLRKVIEQCRHEVTLRSISDCSDLDLLHFDKIVIGASIRYGRHRPLVIDFISRNREILDAKPNAFFSVNVVARKPEKSRSETNPYLQKFLKRISWRPRELAVFAGRIDYPSYGTFDRLMIRMIMWMTKGPTDPKGVVEFTDWNQVESFGRLISEM